MSDRPATRSDYVVAVIVVAVVVALAIFGGPILSGLVAP